MNARDARELSARFNDNPDTAQIHYVFGAIRKAASAGVNKLTITVKKMGEREARHLSTLGYSVNHVSDQRDGSFYEIRW